MMVLWCLIEKNSSLNLVLKKVVSLTKFYLNIKRFMDISGKGLLYFHQETSSLISSQTNHRTYIFFCLIYPTLAMSPTIIAFVL